eukprot:gene16921-18627_t
MAGIANVAKIFVTRKLPDAAMELLQASRHTVDFWPHPETTIPRQALVEKAAGVDGLLCLLTEKVDAELLNIIGPQLKVVSTMSVGFDHVDCSELKKRNILLGNTPEVLTDATADLTMALLLATSRRLLEANKAAKDGKWGTWSPLWMCGSNLKDSTVGIFGLGRIGSAVSRRLKPFGVSEILYNQDIEVPAIAQDVGATFVSIDELLQRSDFVLACCALTDETRRMFNKSLFAKMKKTAIFINTSRGDVVNQADLVEALQEGTIKAAGLDVTTPEPLPVDHPLFKMSNAVVLPHIASAEEKTRTAMAVLAAKNLLAALDGKQMPAESSPNALAVVPVQESAYAKMKKIISSPRGKRRASTAPPAKVFGVGLEEILSRDGSEIGVPSIVQKMCEFILKNGLLVEGIFRVNANMKTVEKLKTAIDKYGDVDLEETNDVMAVASLLKMFLRELPDSVVPYEMQPGFIKAQSRS